MDSVNSAYLQGRLLRLRFHPPSLLAPVTGSTFKRRSSRAPRGKVRGLSRKSSKRLRSKVARLGWRPALFITLTSRPEWPRDPHRMKKKLFNFLYRWLSPRLPRRHVVFWVMEFTQAGMVHFHLLVFTRGRPPFIEHSELQSSWGAHVWIELARSERVASYVAKYVTKATRDSSLDHTDISARDGGGYTGRVWGVWNRSAYWDLVMPVRRVDFRDAIRLPEVARLFDWLREQGILHYIDSLTVELRRPPPLLGPHGQPRAGTSTAVRGEGLDILCLLC